MSNVFEGSEANFLHNEDYSGDIKISTASGEVWVPLGDLLGFALEYVKFQRCENVEAEKALEG